MFREETVEIVGQFKADKNKVYLQNRNMATMSNIEIIEKLCSDELKLLDIGMTIVCVKADYGHFLCIMRI